MLEVFIIKSASNILVDAIGLSILLNILSMIIWLPLQLIGRLALLFITQTELEEDTLGIVYL